DRGPDGRTGVSPVGLGNWRHPGIFDLDSNRALEKCDRQHQAVMSSEIQQDSLQPTKRPVLDSHPLSNLQERPGLAWEPRLDRHPYRSNFGLVNGYRNSAHSSDKNNARGCKNWESI